jgi:hypothetical protein
MDHPSKVQQPIERQVKRAEKKTQRKDKKDVKTANRYATRQLRMQLKHERDMKKIESGYYHTRAEKLAEVGKPLSEALGKSLVPTLGILSGLIKVVSR